MNKINEFKAKMLVAETYYNLQNHSQLLSEDFKRLAPQSIELVQKWFSYLVNYLKSNFTAEQLDSVVFTMDELSHIFVRLYCKCTNLKYINPKNPLQFTKNSKFFELAPNWEADLSGYFDNLELSNEDTVIVFFQILKIFKLWGKHYDCE